MIRFGVFALGSSAYPHFCGFGKWLDLVFHELGGRRIVPIGLGDELGDREGAFKEWSKRAFKQACLDYNVVGTEGSASPNDVPIRWKKVKMDLNDIPGSTRMEKISHREF